MASNIVRLPLDYFADPTKGRPVFNGSVFIGNPDTDPEILGNRKTVTVRQEDGTEVPISGPGQPLLTGSGGVILYNGSPVQVLTDGNYSIKVLNAQGSQVYFFENALDGEPITIDSTIAVKNFLTIEGGTAITSAAESPGLVENDAVNAKEKTAGNGGGSMWDVVLTTSVTPNTFNIVISVANALLSLVLRTDSVVNARAGGAPVTGDALAAIQALIDDSTITRVVIPEGFSFEISAPLNLKSNFILEVNGTLKLADAAVSDADFYVVGHTADITKVKVVGKGIIQGPVSTTRRAVGVFFKTFTTLSSDVHVGADLTFKDLRAGIDMQEVTDGTIGTCNYDNMLGVNPGGASNSGACITLQGASSIVVGDVNGKDIHKSAMQLTASGPNLTIPTNITVGNVNIAGPSGGGEIPAGLGLRAGVNISIESITTFDTSYVALLSAETNTEHFQNITIGSINGKDCSADGVLIRDIRAAGVLPCEKVSVGIVIVEDIAGIGYRVQKVDDTKTTSLTIENAGTGSSQPGISASDSDNCQFGSVHINKATGDGINILRCNDFGIDNANLEDVGTAGTGFDGVVVSGNASDTKNGHITRLSVTGGLYDYAVNVTQPLGAEFTVESFTGDKGTLDFFNQSPTFLLGGKSLQANLDGSNSNEMPLGSTRRGWIISSVQIVSSAAITADNTNFHTFTIKDKSGNTLATLNTTISSGVSLSAFTPSAMAITSANNGSQVNTGFTVTHAETGSPTSINTFSIQINYYDR